jgi:hypothetical protein
MLVWGGLLYGFFGVTFTSIEAGFSFGRRAGKLQGLFALALMRVRGLMAYQVGWSVDRHRHTGLGER